jgi:deoxyxylulose-5-phosphate synthase
VTVSLLDGIRGPDDVRRLSKDQLQPLADEVRRRLVDVVSQTGGHIGAGLGVVELTVALCHVFESPRDKIVWDVGHQGYPWKILTGRGSCVVTKARTTSSAPVMPEPPSRQPWGWRPRAISRGRRTRSSP